MTDDPNRPDNDGAVTDAESADARMDARLRLAGERWRAADLRADDDPISCEFDVLDPRRGRSVRAPKRRRIVSIAAAAAVVAALGIALPLTLGGGDNTSAASPPPLRGTAWRLVAVGNAEPDANSPVALSISSSGKLTADDECTVLGASVTSTVTSIDVSKQIVRYKSCTDQYGVRLSNAIEVLKGKSRYSIAGDGLTIGTGNSALHFTALPTDFPAPTLDTPTFVGATWKLASAKNADGAAVKVNSVGDRELVISDDGRFAAGLGCHGTSGTVTDLESRPNFVAKGLAAGPGPCQGGGDLAVVRAVLSGRVQETVFGNTLTITKSGAGTLVYRWVPKDSAATDASALFEHNWVLISAGGVAVSDRLRLDLGRQDGTWSAQNGCGSLAGRVTAARGAISFDESGDHICTGAERDESNRISVGVAGATLFRFEGDALTLYGDVGQAGGLVYVRGADSPVAATSAPGAPTTSAQPPLIGTTWTLDPSSVRGSLGGDKITSLRLRIDDDGSFDTNGCDPRSGSATVQDDRITFDPFAGADCSPSPTSRRQSDHALAAMVKGTVTWSISGGRLRLTKGSTTIVFDAR